MQFSIWKQESNLLPRHYQTFCGPAAKADKIISGKHITSQELCG